MRTPVNKGKTQISKKVISREENVGLTYKFLKEGKTIKEIEDFFAENQQLKPITVRIYLMDARKLISTEADMDIDFTSALHDSRYEGIWEEDKNAYLEWIFAPEENWERAQNSEIIRRYSSLLVALKQRENMYGLRSKDLVLALHSNISLTKDYKADSFEHFLSKQFDINKLDLAEKVELLQILEESYEGNMFDKQEYIVENDEEVEEKKVRAIDHQKSKEVIVESIKQIKDQPKPPKQLITKKTASIVVKDFTGDKTSKTPEQVQDKIKNSVMDYIKEKYKK